MSEQTLVVAAHPDDEVLGCGGILSNCEILILGEGITARYDNPADAPLKELSELREQAREVAKAVGANVRFCQFPDNRFDTISLLKIVKEVEKVISEVKPVTIYTHHGGDLNIDHRITYQAVLTATRPPTVKSLYTFEVPSATEWTFDQSFKPNTFIEIDAQKKIDLLKIYDKEMRKYPHPRSPQAIQARLQYWGSIAGGKEAEAFQLIRQLNGN